MHCYCQCQCGDACHVSSWLCHCACACHCHCACACHVSSGHCHCAGACHLLLLEAVEGWRPCLRRAACFFSSFCFSSISVRPDVFFWVPDLRACSWYSGAALCSWIELANMLSHFRIVSVAFSIEACCCSVAGKPSSIANLASEISGRPVCQIAFAIRTLPQRLRSTASALLLFLVQDCAFCLA